MILIINKHEKNIFNNTQHVSPPINIIEKIPGADISLIPYLFSEKYERRDKRLKYNPDNIATVITDLETKRNRELQLLKKSRENTRQSSKIKKYYRLSEDQRKYIDSQKENKKHDPFITISPLSVNDNNKPRSQYKDFLPSSITPKLQNLISLVNDYLPTPKQNASPSLLYDVLITPIFKRLRQNLENEPIPIIYLPNLGAFSEQIILYYLHLINKQISYDYTKLSIMKMIERHTITPESAIPYLIKLLHNKLLSYERDSKKIFLSQRKKALKYKWYWLKKIIKTDNVKKDISECLLSLNYLKIQPHDPYLDSLKNNLNLWKNPNITIKEKFISEKKLQDESRQLLLENNILPTKDSKHFFNNSYQDHILSPLPDLLPLDQKELLLDLLPSTPLRLISHNNQSLLSIQHSYRNHVLAPWETKTDNNKVLEIYTTAYITILKQFLSYINNLL